MWGVWGDERGRDRNPSVEIAMHGLGVFACRRGAWPGLNPRLRGFGAEEGCLHEKFRQRGATTLCLPFLRWLHRFERPFGALYETRWDDRIRNYLILFDELDLDASPVVQHFEELLGGETAQPIVEAVKKEIASPFSFFDAIYCINLDRDRAAGIKLQHFRALGVSEAVRRFSAFETPYNHHIGCTLSHRAIIAEAKRLGLQNVLVFEDDVDFAGDTQEVLENALRELGQRQWWMLYLGTHLGRNLCSLVAASFPGAFSTLTHARAETLPICDRTLRMSLSALRRWRFLNMQASSVLQNVLGSFG
jgi:hypothetical protein